MFYKFGAFFIVAGTVMTLAFALSDYPFFGFAIGFFTLYSISKLDH